ncbi:cationic amino acid transporter, putative [Ixodes scapularis]|uniref:Cationic amino acid transporter, putative n=1 Tax=Ixodes scapularis TaxID=6945 RepID=B7PX55_IXOSC|nr:cationic amino acid transporter, putative [Ixodes scapularis]|eukprot:XP_002410523.1 cationic amino acid transporter, putative [Ixodes scapularis]
MLSAFLQKLRRTKEPGADHMQTNLKRCLTTFDITLLGIGHMMGSGIYVLTPAVAKGVAGPALIVSYLVAGVASLLAALAYAEFGVRFPRAGSAYSYAYFSVGEFWAFFVGWNVVLENVIGISAVSRACSAYIDSLTHGAIKGYIMNVTGEMPGPYLSAHPDFLALLIIVLYVAFMSVGVQATSWLNNILCCVNIFVLFIIIGVGAYFADFSNWTNPDTGGFAPFGCSRVIGGARSRGAAYERACLSFALIAAESRLTKSFCCNCDVMVMSQPSRASKRVHSQFKMRVAASIRTAVIKFSLAGVDLVRFIVVIIGALCGMSTVLIGTLYALTRIAYAMADDGLIMRMFGTVNKRTKIPLIAMYVFSALAAVLAVILDIETLVEMMSIGTLFAYLVVSGGIIIFRYRAPTKKLPNGVGGSLERIKPRFRRLAPLLSGLSTDLAISLSVCGLVAVTLVLGFFVQSLSAELAAGAWWAVLVVIVLCLLLVLLFTTIAIHEQVITEQRYKMPFVPFLPALSIVVNTILMTTLHALTWLRLLVWISVGLTGYFVYGTQHSKLNKLPESNGRQALESPSNGKQQNSRL